MFYEQDSWTWPRKSDKEFIFVLIENWEFGINSVRAKKLYNESLKKISLSVAWRRQWGLVWGPSRKPILKAYRLEMKMLNQLRGSRHDRQEMGLCDALMEMWTFPGVRWMREMTSTDTHHPSSALLSLSSPTSHISSLRLDHMSDLVSSLGANPFGSSLMENFLT